MIFSRKRGSGRHAAPKRERDDFDDVVDTDDDETTSARDVGPYDIDDVSGDPEGLDLGSLRVPVPPGVELRVQADPDGQIQQVEKARFVEVTALPGSARGDGGHGSTGGFGDVTR